VVNCILSPINRLLCRRPEKPDLDDSSDDIPMGKGLNGEPTALKQPHIDMEKQPNIDKQKQPNIDKEKQPSIDKQKQPHIDKEKQPELEKVKQPMKLNPDTFKTEVDIKK